MFKTRVRKIFRDVLARKGRTALVSIAIFIGVMGTIALCSMSTIITTQLNEDIKKDELAMLDAYLASTEDAEFDDAQYLESIRQEFPDITDLVAMGAYFTQFKTDEDSDDLDDVGVYAFSDPLEEPQTLEPFRLIEGNYPAAGQNQLMVELRMAEERELSVGDTIYVRVLSPSSDPALDGQIGAVEPWEITGIVFHPYTGSGTALSLAPDNAMYAQVEDAQYIGGNTGFTAYRARFADFDQAEDQENAFTQFIANETPYKVVFSQTYDPNANALIQQAAVFTNTMSFLAVVALIVSGFLVINVISSIITEQRRQIGIMKTIGASGFDNFFIFTGIAFVYGILGVIPGLLVGIPLGNILAHFLGDQLNTYLDGFQWSPQGIVIGVLLGLAVPVLAALLPVFMGIRVRILEAISDVGITSRYGTGPVAKIIGALPFPPTIRQGLSNVSMKPLRTLLTVITLAVAVGAFIGIFGVLSAIEDGFGSFLDIFNVEVGVIQAGGLGGQEEIIAAMEANEQIENVEPAVSVEVGFVDYEPEATAGGPPGILGYGFDVTSDDPAFRIQIDEGENLNADNAGDGIIMTSNLAEGLGVGVGDMAELELPAGTREVVVIGLIDYPINIVFADWHLLAEVAGFTEGAPVPNQYMTQVEVDGADAPITAVGLSYSVAEQVPYTEGGGFTAENPGVVITQSLADTLGVGVDDMVTLTSTVDGGTNTELPVVGIIPPLPQLPEENALAVYWETLAELEGRSTEGDPVPQAYFATTTISEPTKEQIDDVIDELEESFLDRGLSVQTLNFVEFQEMFTEAIRYIQIILQAVVLLIAAVGALGLLTTLSMSVFERQKEIGVMRSIGASSSTVSLQFLTEGIVVGIISWLVGLPVAALIQFTLLEVSELRETFGFQFDIQGALLALVGVLIITTIASLWPSIGAARKTVSDILRYQ